MKYLITACLISESALLSPRRHVLDFIDQNSIALTFPTCIDIERGIQRIAIAQPEKAARLRMWFGDIVERLGYFDGMVPEVARQFALIASCKQLNTVWTPPSDGRYMRTNNNALVAALSIAHGLPIATMNTKAFVEINEYFPIPGVYHPLTGTWQISPLPNAGQEMRAAKAIPAAAPELRYA